MLKEFKKFLDEELGIDDDITLETSLRDDLMIDSLATTQLVLSLEENRHESIQRSWCIMSPTYSPIVKEQKVLVMCRATLKRRI